MKTYNIVYKIVSTKKDGDDTIRLFNFGLKNPSGYVEIIIKQISESYTDQSIRYVLLIAPSYNGCKLIGELSTGTFCWPHWKTLLEETCFIGNDYGTYGLYLKPGVFFNSDSVNITINDYGSGQSNSNIFNICQQSLIHSATPSLNSCLSTNILDKKYTKLKQGIVFNGGITNPPCFIDNWDRIAQTMSYYGFNNVDNIPFDGDGNIELPYQTLIGINQTNELGRNVGNNLYAYDGNPLGVRRSGTTTDRPTGVKVGFQFFDTTLGKPIWWNGSAWVDTTGATI